MFDDPFKFDVDPLPNEHVAFGGGGPHFCLGANLARMEINIMFDEVLDRLHDIELTGDVERLRSNFINGLKHIPLKFKATRSTARLEVWGFPANPWPSFPKPQAGTSRDDLSQKIAISRVGGRRARS